MDMCMATWLFTELHLLKFLPLWRKLGSEKNNCVCDGLVNSRASSCGKGRSEPVCASGWSQPHSSSKEATAHTVPSKGVTAMSLCLTSCSYNPGWACGQHSARASLPSHLHLSWARSVDRAALMPLSYPWCLSTINVC